MEGRFAARFDTLWIQLVQAPFPCRQSWHAPHQVIEASHMDLLQHEALDNNEHNRHDMTEVLLPLYVNEVWLGETPPQGLEDRTGELLELAVADDYEGFERIALPAGAPVDRLWCKCRNLLQAATDLFGPQSRFAGLGHADVADTLTVEFVHSVHQQVMDGLERRPGEFRTVQVRPIGSSTVYAPHAEVAARLEALLQFTRATLPNLDRPQAVKFAGLFLSEFLLIHPYRNGNGRVARLLVSHLLRGMVWVPVSLYFRNRDLYIEVLNQRAEALHQPPVGVAMYVLDCVLKAISDALYLTQ